MAIDASIYGQIQQPKPVNLLAQYAQMMEMQNAQERMGQEREMNQLRRMELQRTAEERDAKRNWLASNSPEAFGVDGGNALTRMLWEGARAGAIPVSDYFSAIKPKDPKYQTVGGSLVRTDTPTPTVAFTAPEKPEPTPTAIREYEFAKGQGYGGTYEQWVISQKKAGASSTSVSLGSPVAVELPGGGIGYVQPANKPGAAPQLLQLGGKPLTKPSDTAGTEGERTAAGYAARMTAAEKLISEVAKANPDAQKPGLIEHAAGGVGVVANMSRDADRQKYRQAQEDWVRAKLRKESGAVIANEEMEREISVYFPQLGDKPEVIKQKAEARKVAEQSMRQAGGKAVKAPAQSSGPAPGLVQDGYRFKGGNPADPKSWEKV